MAGKYVETTMQGVAALRSFAKACPAAGNEIVEATNKLYAAFKSMETELGPHTGEMEEIIRTIQVFIQNAKEPIERASSDLMATADEIEAFIGGGGMRTYGRRR